MDFKNSILGLYKGYIYTIEYQKRTLLHMHLLLFIKRELQFNTPALIDQVVCAELPNPSQDPTGKLTAVVISQMSHGPCSADNPMAPCMVCKTPNGLLVCSKGFPKPFSANTIVYKDSYLEYQQ